MSNDTTTGLPSESLISSAAYDKLKPLVTIILPAVTTLYFALSNVWGWANEEKVMGTLVALTTFLGVVLGIASKSFNASDKKFTGGAVYLKENDDGSKALGLRLDIDPEDIGQYSDLVFKVMRPVLPEAA